jgi:hypothetical protein
VIEGKFKNKPKNTSIAVKIRLRKAIFSVDNHPPLGFHGRSQGLIEKPMQLNSPRTKPLVRRNFSTQTYLLTRNLRLTYHKPKNDQSTMRILWILSALSLIAFTGIAQSEKETRPLSNNIVELRVNEGIEVEWVPSNENKIEIITTGVGADKIITDMGGGVLRIRMRTGIYTGASVRCVVYVEDLRQLQANSGARIFADKSIKTDRLSLKSTAGGVIILNVETDRLFTEANTAGRIELTGRANLHVANFTGGAILDGAMLMTEDTDIRANSGASADITATKNLTARANTGATIRYRGNPGGLSVSTQLGANIIAIN